MSLWEYSHSNHHSSYSLAVTLHLGVGIFEISPIHMQMPTGAVILQVFIKVTNNRVDISWVPYQKYRTLALSRHSDSL